MSCYDLKTPLPRALECSNTGYSNAITGMTIKGDKLFFDTEIKKNQYYGNVISITDKEIKAVCKNGNRYMEGTILTICLPKQKNHFAHKNRLINS